MGSKSRIAKYIVPIIQDYIDKNSITTYIEPFVGGANVIDKIRCDVKIGGDSNKYLIAFWKEIQNGWNPLTDVKMNKNYYESVKQNPDAYNDKYVALCGLFATYNAVWFGSYAGIVKTKTGIYRDYYNEAVRNVLKQADNVKDVEFLHCDYKNIYCKNSVIYCDPPYAGTAKYKDDIDHDEYWEWVRKMSKNNIVLCSEYNAPSDFECIWQKETFITLRHNTRRKAIEKLFIYNGKNT